MPAAAQKTATRGSGRSEASAARARQLGSELDRRGVVTRDSLRTLPSDDVVECYRRAADLPAAATGPPAPAGSPAAGPAPPLVAQMLAGCAAPPGGEVVMAAAGTRPPRGTPPLDLGGIIAACLVLRGVPALRAVAVVAEQRARAGSVCEKTARPCLELSGPTREWMVSLAPADRELAAAFLVWQATHVAAWNPSLALYQQLQGGGDDFTVHLQRPPQHWYHTYWWIWVVIGVVIFIAIVCGCIHARHRQQLRRAADAARSGKRPGHFSIYHPHARRGRHQHQFHRRVLGRSTLHPAAATYRRSRRR